MCEADTVAIPCSMIKPSAVTVTVTIDIDGFVSATISIPTSLVLEVVAASPLFPIDEVSVAVLVSSSFFFFQDLVPSTAGTGTGNTAIILRSCCCCC